MLSANIITVTTTVSELEVRHYSEKPSQAFRLLHIIFKKAAHKLCTNSKLFDLHYS